MYAFGVTRGQRPDAQVKTLKNENKRSAIQWSPSSRAEARLPQALGYGAPVNNLLESPI